MVQVVVSDEVNGGFLEGNAAYKAKWGMEINQLPLPTFGKLLVSDASSPVANFRVEEAFTSLVAISNTHPNVDVITDLGCGGTYDDYGKHWHLTPRANVFWSEFYESTGIMDRIDVKLAPISDGIYTAIQLRKKLIAEMWSVIEPHMNGKLRRNIQRFDINVYEEEFESVKINQLIGAIPEGGVVIKFPCIVCSHQAHEAVYHAMRRKGSSVYVAKNDRSPAHSGCKGGFAWIEHWTELTVWEATFLLGGRLSGKAIYYLSGMSDNKPAITIRDYSDPRGTIAATVDNWTQELWISPRVYLHHKSGEGTIHGFVESLKSNAEQWANIISTFPMLGNGRQFDVIY